MGARKAPSPAVRSLALAVVAQAIRDAAGGVFLTPDECRRGLTPADLREEAECFLRRAAAGREECFWFQAAGLDPVVILREVLLRERFGEARACCAG